MLRLYITVNCSYIKRCFNRCFLRLSQIQLCHKYLPGLFGMRKS
ncbi:MAG: hypothetical protein ACLFVV_03135 [Coleofasciculus sp.]